MSRKPTTALATTEGAQPPASQSPEQKRLDGLKSKLAKIHTKRQAIAQKQREFVKQFGSCDAVTPELLESIRGCQARLAVIARKQKAQGGYSTSKAVTRIEQSIGKLGEVIGLLSTSVLEERANTLFPDRFNSSDDQSWEIKNLNRDIAALEKKLAKRADPSLTDEQREKLDDAIDTELERAEMDTAPDYDDDEDDDEP